MNCKWEKCKHWIGYNHESEYNEEDGKNPVSFNSLLFSRIVGKSFIISL